MKSKIIILAVMGILGLSFGCNTTAPTSQTSIKTTTDSNLSANGNSQNVVITSGNQTLNVKQSNGIAEISGNGKTLRVETNRTNADGDAVDPDNDSDDDSDSVVSDERENRVATKTQDGKQTSVVESGDDKIRVETEAGKNKDSEVSDSKGNKVKMKNGKIEIQSADGKKIVVTAPN